jgi:hypothetical protein
MIIPMNESFDMTKIFGKWNINVDTPFGKENYTINIDSFGELKGNDYYLYYEGLAGSVEYEKNIVLFDNASFLDGTFKCVFNVEFPIKATVNLQASVIDDNKMFGSLQIDQYVETLFIGVR